MKRNINAIKEKLTEKLLSKGKEFHYEGQCGKGTGYVKLVTSCSELLSISE